jgi:hypothetical protein
MLPATCCLALFAILVTISQHGAPANAPRPLAQRFMLLALGHPGSVSLSQYAGRPVLIRFFSSTGV